MEFFARAFLENGDKSIIERVALGMKRAAEHQEIVFPENSMLPQVNPIAEDSSFGYRYGECVFEDQGRRDELTKKYPDREEEILDIQRSMDAFVTQKQVMNALSERDMHLIENKACWGGTWGGHSNPDYDRLLHLGTGGIRSLIEKYRRINPEKDAFYDACAYSMDAIDILGRRIREKAEYMAENDPSENGRRIWKRIAKAFERIPFEPANDMHDAVLFFSLVYTFDGVDSPGRFDQFMIDFYRNSSAEENDEMLDRFLEMIHNVRGWNLCLSGSDENWADESNALTFAMLKKVKEKGYQTPNLTLRVHRNTPEAVYRLAAQSIATGIGLPALYNDEVVCRALEKIGIPPEDSHDYCMNGCNQIDIMGKSHMGLEDGEVNLAKALEYTLHMGIDLFSGGGERMTKPHGDPRSMECFSDFLSLYYKHLDELTDACVDMANKAQKCRSMYGSNPLRSCLHQGCLEKGTDYQSGGPLYGHGQILAEGIADAADSIYAVKKLVYDEKKYTMAQLIQALEADFEGYEKIRLECMGCDKFGNDIAEADELCAQIVLHFFTYLKTKETYRGGVYTGGCSPFNRAAVNGMHTSALPNGRKNGESNFADSISATPGNDMKGPTASIKSMLHYDQTEACSGFVAQMKFTKALFNTEKGMDAFVNLAKAYFANGGQQLSVNVVDREELLRARENPEKYKNLIVRVGGYSDYFVNLTDELQQNVIERSEFEV
ncbi:MAG: hypothetical protein IJC48_02385 [Clostridia bacterium]|nr:hypothetical protein [Clostridia bacterium]